ncbi:MAG: glycosyltransferase family 39 protein [Anaerolineae bacterium]|nr:glycosyltransferase family 39 protein [Anaerolineae bacterium]
MMTIQPSRLRNIAIGIAMLLALGFQVVAIHEQSLSGDGVHHLIAGYQALRYGQNRLNLEHPPFVKTIISLPLLDDPDYKQDPTEISQLWPAMHDFHNNPDFVRRITIRSRYLMLLVFVLPFFASCYLLGCRFGGQSVGLILFLLVAFSYSMIPYLTILQTDTAVSLAYLLTLLASFQLVKGLTFQRAILVGLAFGFALSVKFSGFLLLPTVIVAIGLADNPEQKRGLRLTVAVAILIISWTVLHLSYLPANWNYDQAIAQETIRNYTQGKAMIVHDKMQRFEELLIWLEGIDAYGAQWLTGFLGVYTQNAIGVYPTYTFGRVSQTGHFWYFPAMLLIKLPLALLLTALIGVIYNAQSQIHKLQKSNTLAQLLKEFTLSSSSNPSAEKLRQRQIILVIVTVVSYLGVAMGSNYNIGFRHLMPIIPLLYLPLAVFVAGRYWVTALLVGLLVIESTLLAPLWMSATNTWWLGSYNPSRLAFSLGNMDYGQNYIQLAKYSKQKNINTLYFVYPGLEAWRVQAYIPGAVVIDPDDPLKPGWYAVPTRIEQYVPALLESTEYPALKRIAQQWDPIWQTVKTGQDFGYAAGTFHIYYLDEVQPTKPDKTQNP